ncbi:b(0,+)-type amino acid transporter 1-like [Patiria miniata]|uniref:Uncharacterized protein n=1 Tax=Patiria miniata TaxID=46514 RepID=A0A914A7W7_PATMI|nr:b(0,+)-type amino acid transporter 1-like [Patiria miniata]
MLRNIFKGRFKRKHNEATPLKTLELPHPSYDNNKERGTVHLKREVGLVRGVSLIVGAMIGSGIFISPKGVLVGAHSVGMSLIIWVVCGVVSILAAMCYAELGTFVPKSGGTYQYVLLAYGDLAGFVVSWFLVILSPSSTALAALTLGTYISDYVIAGDCPSREAVQLFAILTTLLMLFINCISVRYASGLAVVFSSGKVIALVIIIVTGIFKLCKGQTQYLDPSTSFAGSNTHLEGYGIALYYGFYAYGGWDILNNLSEEIENPARNLPLSICIAVPSVVVIYLLTNIAYFTTLSPDEVLASSAVAVSFAERTLGPMSWVIPVGVCISTAGNILGGFLASSRITYAAGREGHMLKVLSMINVKLLTPLPAVILKGILVIIFILLGDFDSIIVFNGFVAWIFHLAAFTSLIVLRFKFPDKPSPFKASALIIIVSLTHNYIHLRFGVRNGIFKLIFFSNETNVIEIFDFHFLGREKNVGLQNRY